MVELFNYLDKLAIFAAIALPLFNLPLIMRIVKRRSSADISLLWAVGVWVCLLVMFHSGINSKDVIWKTFSIVNFILFSAVVVFTIVFRKRMD